ncbi:MAG: CapA family protein [Christensenellaceae bacterium]|nr:CapA family protein [Christensenellaceae bacterium]
MKKLFSLLLALALTIGMAGGVQARPLNRAQAVYPRSIRMSKPRLTLTNAYKKPGSFQLRATTVPALIRLTDKKLTWSSDDPSIAEVDENGLVTAVGEGATYVRVGVKGKDKALGARCRVTVKAVRVKKLTLNPTALTLDPDVPAERSKIIAAAIAPGNATYPQVTWESSDETVATVDDKGVVTAKGAGLAVITAAADNKRVSARCTVRVRGASAGMVPVVISAGGDIVLGGVSWKNTDKHFEERMTKDGKHDYTYVLKHLRKVFEKDDLTILNLENALTGDNPKVPSRKFNFVGKPEYAKILVEGSVEVVNVSNNHTDDHGTKKETIQILRNQNLVISDDLFNIAESSAMANGVRVGFVGLRTPYPHRAYKTTIQDARKRCDVLVVSFHFGEVPEWTHSVLPSQIKRAREAIDLGADLVLGHHPHFIQGIELYKGKYIFYGLGAVESSGDYFSFPNFIMQQTIMVDPKTGATEPQVPTVYPIFTSGAAKVKGKSNGQPVLLARSDKRYNEVKKLIDTYSIGGGMAPAPYNLG